MAKPIPDKRFYNVAEIVEHTGKPEGTIRRWMNTGLLKHRHFGRNAVIAREDFLWLLDGNLDLSSHKKGR